MDAAHLDVDQKLGHHLKGLRVLFKNGLVRRYLLDKRVGCFGMDDSWRLGSLRRSGEQLI